LNRYFLIGGLLISLTFPLFRFSDIFLKEITKEYYFSVISVFVQNSSISNANNFISWIDILKIIYITVSSFLLLKLIYSILRIIVLVRHSRIISTDVAKIVNTRNFNSQFSFFNYIFMNWENLKQNDKERILAHELGHVKGFHSLDILFMEFIICFFWFNPIIWLYRYSLKSVHEFIADELVLKTKKDIEAYKELLFMHIWADWITNCLTILIFH